MSLAFDLNQRGTRVGLEEAQNQRSRLRKKLILLNA